MGFSKKEWNETKNAAKIALNWNKASDQQKGFAVNQLKDVGKLTAGLVVSAVVGKYLLAKASKENAE